MKKQVDALKFLNLSNKIDELKQIEHILKKQLNDLIIGKLKDIMEYQNNIKLDNLEHIAKRGKHYSISKYSLPIVFKRYTRRKFVFRRRY